MRVAFDIGGTFTDFVLEDGRAGALHFHKVPTTPRDPAKAVLEGLAVLLQNAKVAFGEVSSILHATTVATNAILERKGARTALITTEGFRDISSSAARSATNLRHVPRKPVPLVRRRDIFEVRERVAGRRHASSGRSMRPRWSACWRAWLRRTTSRSPSASCTPTPRRRTSRRSGERLRAKLPTCRCRSPRRLAEVPGVRARQHEVANAYIEPIVGSYVSRLDRRAEGAGHHVPTSSSCSRTAAWPRPSSPAICRCASSSRARRPGVLLCGDLGQGGGPRARDLLRHGRHDGEARRHRRRRPADHAQFEVDQVRYRKGSGLPHQHPGHRPGRDRRRRRQHRAVPNGA